MDVPFDRQMLVRRLHVLPEGQDVRALRGDFFHRLQHFVARLAEAQHHSRFCGHIRRHFARAAQEFERPLVDRSLAHPAIEPRHRLHVVVEHIRPRCHHFPKRRPVAAEIRNQHFDFAVGNALAYLLDCARENRRASVPLVVAVHRRHHRVTQPHPFHCFRHAPGFVFFGRP